MIKIIAIPSITSPTKKEAITAIINSKTIGSNNSLKNIFKTLSGAFLGNSLFPYLFILLVTSFISKPSLLLLNLVSNSSSLIA